MLVMDPVILLNFVMETHQSVQLTIILQMALNVIVEITSALKGSARHFSPSVNFTSVRKSFGVNHFVCYKGRQL